MEKFSTTKTFVSGMADLIPAVNDSPYKRIFSFGDIHGCFDKLTSLLDKVCLNEEDLAIFVGDFIDRGDNVADTLKGVIEQSKKKNFIFLRGNHEQMLLDTFHKRMNKLTWAFNGGCIMEK